jgi:putative transposase
MIEYIYGFVLMPNLIHLLGKLSEGIKASDLQRDFLKYTSQQIQFDLIKYHLQVLEYFRGSSDNNLHSVN